MRKSKFGEPQRRFALLAVEAGWTVTEVCRELGVTRMTFYRWKKELTSDHAPEVRGVLAALQAAPKSPESLRAGLKALAPPAAMAPTRAELDRMAARKLRGLAKVFWWMGYRRLHQLMLRQGFTIGLARTYRLYQSQRLALRPMRQKASPDGRVNAVPKDLHNWQPGVT